MNGPGAGQRETKGWWLLLVVLSSLGLGAGLYETRFGSDLSPDSAVYATAGILFAHGEGLSQPNLKGPPEPMTWYPPFVSWVVAVIEKCGWEITRAYGIFSSLTWGLLVGAVGFLAWRVSGQNAVLGGLAAGVILTNSAICQTHELLLSEAPFLLWLVGSLAALGNWWDQPRLRVLVVAGVFVAGALLTRYVGASLALLGGALVLLRPGLRWPARLGHATLFCALSVGPLAAWIAWQRFGGEGAPPRPLELHPITWDYFLEGFSNVTSFLVPKEFAASSPAQGAVAGAALVLLFDALRRWLRGNAAGWRAKLSETPGVVWASVGFVLCYLAFLIVSISVADAETRLDERILVMLIPPLTLAGAFLVSQSFWLQGGPKVRLFLWAGGAALLVLHALSTVLVLQEQTTVTWPPGQPSALGEAVRALPKGALIYSDQPPAVYWVSRRKTELLPDDLPDSEADAEERGEFTAEVGEFKRSLRAKGGWIVYFNKLRRIEPRLPFQALRKAVPTARLQFFDDGILVQVPPRRPR